MNRKEDPLRLCQPIDQCDTLGFSVTICYLEQIHFSVAVLPNMQSCWKTIKHMMVSCLFTVIKTQFLLFSSTVIENCTGQILKPF